MTSFLELISTFSRESFVPSKKHIIDIAMKLDHVVSRMLSQKAYEVMIVGGKGGTQYIMSMTPPTLTLQRQAFTAVLC